MKKNLLQTVALSLCLSLLLSCSKSTDKTDKEANTTETETNPQLAEGQSTTKSRDELLSMGEHLVITSVCDDCHSPKKYTNGMPEPIQDKRLSGHPANKKLKPYDQATIKAGYVLGNEDFTAWIGPWGTSFAANLTPDKETGIGNWKEENFFRAMREGKYHGLEDSRMLLPPMPWPNFAKFTDDELRAIFTYLQSLPAVKNAVPAPIPPKGA